MQLSKNFDLQELTKSQEALRRGIDNTPTSEQLANIKTLVKELLQPIRNMVGPMVVNSGFRCKEVNDLVGSKDTSQHLKGEAADIEANTIDNLTLAKCIQKNFQFDELILECYTPGDPRSGWVHVSYCAGQNKNEVFTAYRKDGKMVYEKGLKENA